MIEKVICQKLRLEKLNNIAKKQYNILKDSNSIKRIQDLDENNIKKIKLCV